MKNIGFPAHAWVLIAALMMMSLSSSSNHGTHAFIDFPEFLHDAALGKVANTMVSKSKLQPEVKNFYKGFRTGDKIHRTMNKVANNNDNSPAPVVSNSELPPELKNIYEGFRTGDKIDRTMNKFANNNDNSPAPAPASTCTIPTYKAVYYKQNTYFKPTGNKVLSSCKLLNPSNYAPQTFIQTSNWMCEIPHSISQPYAQYPEYTYCKLLLNTNLNPNTMVSPSPGGN